MVHVYKALVGDLGTVSAVQAGALLTLFFAWIVSQTFEELETKRSVMMHVRAAHPLLYQ